MAIAALINEIKELKDTNNNLERSCAEWQSLYNSACTRADELLNKQDKLYEQALRIPDLEMEKIRLQRERDQLAQELRMERMLPRARSRSPHGESSGSAAPRAPF